MARLSLFSIPLLTALICAVCLGSGRAQSLPSLALPSMAPAAQLPGGVRQEGLYNTAPISVDGVPLFRIATPANVGPDQISVEEREQSIDAAVAQLLAPKTTDGMVAGTIYDPESLRIAIQTSGDQALLVATDAHQKTPLALLTVTMADAKYQKVPVAALAATWQAKLQSALTQALQKRQPAEVERNVTDLWHYGLVLLAATLFVFLLLSLIGRRVASLQGRIEKDAREMERAASGDPEHPSAPRQRLRFMGLLIRSADPQMRLRVLRAVSGILWCGLAVAWFFAVLWALALFPQTTPVSHFLRRQVGWLAVVIVAAIVIVRIADIAIVRMARMYAENARPEEGEERSRLLLRVPTVARAISAAFTMVVVFAAVLAGMKSVGISTGSVLTFGGIAALGITFAAQNLLRDFLNGAFVIIEDQYVVGDYVIIDEWSGVVEHMTLRVVQVRDSSGNLITIPHGQVTQVVNCSRNWSRVNYRIPIDARSDVTKAIAVLRDSIVALSGEDTFGGWMLDPVELIGVDAVSASGIVLRASIKTAPLRQFELKRELNLRVVEGFRAAGIAFGVDPASATTMNIVAGPR
jgi:small-conductance mechanosensitive channel